MIKPDSPSNERERLEALKSYHLLDTIPEEAFDDITAIAAQICGTPVALVSLIDEKRQWLKSKFGVPAEVTQLPRELSCCAHAILQPDTLFEVPNASKDERFHDNPLTINAPHIQFYLGVPLVDDGGFALGTLCVIDHRPRKLNKAQKEALSALSRQVMALIKLRKEVNDFETNKSRLLELVEKISDIIYELDDRGRFRYVNPTLVRLSKYSEEELLNIGYYDLIHPDYKDLLFKFYSQQVKDRKDGSYFEFPMVAKTGEIIWIGQTVKIFFDGDRVSRVGAVARDITELRHVSAELEERENLYRLISENSTDVVSLHEPSGEFKYVSPSIKELLGFEPEEIVGTLPIKIFHPKDADRVKGIPFQDIIHYRVDGSVEYRLRKKSGDYIWVESTAKPILNENGELISIQSATRNISIRKKNERLIKKNEANLKALIENSTDTIWSIDREYRYITFNAQFFDIIKGQTGTAPEIGKPINFEDYPSEVTDYWKSLYQRAFQGKRFLEEIRTDDGSAIFENSFYPIAGEDDEIIGVSVFSRDITKRIQQREKREKFQRGLALLNDLSSNIRLEYSEVLDLAIRQVSLFFNMELGLLSKIEEEEQDIEHIFEEEELSSADAFVEKTGPWQLETHYSQQKIVAINDVEDYNFTGINEDDWANAKSYIGGPIMIGKRCYGLISLYSSKKREDRFDSYDQEFLRLFGRWIGAVQERKQYEQLLLDSKEEAIRASQAKADFLSTMSHEIRTPLNAIIGMTHYLLQDEPRVDQLDNLKLLKFSGENLLALVNDVLDINKIESDKITLEQTDFNLRELLESIRQSYSVHLDEKELHCKLYFDADLPETLQGDPVRISQVINNLMSNAIKFTKEGGVKIIAENRGIENGFVNVHLEIRDSGIGINKDKFEQIFERFTQAKTSTTREFGGSGLGLAIVKGLLEVMESQIELESTPGEGSRFYFALRLPLGKEATATKSPMYSTELSGFGLQEFRVLLVEDNRVNQLVASKFLKKWGLEVSLAENGQEGIELYEKEHFDLILMDLQMPIMDGYETTLLIRQKDSSIPILALTAATQMQEKRRAIECGMNDFLVKPLTPMSLYSKISKYLKIRSKESEPASGKNQSPNSQDRGFETLLDLIKGDDAFKMEIVPLYIENVQTISGSFIKKLRAHDVAGADKLRHKMLTTLNTLEATHIQALMDHGLQLISKTSPSLELEQLIKRLEFSCEEIENKLQELLFRPY